MSMTESDLPFIKPGQEISSETDEIISPSSDVKTPLPNHEPIEKMEAGVFDCSICGQPFNTKADLELHLATIHRQTKKA
jgi:hypothetical protein